MSAASLTPKQRELLSYIRDHQARNGTSPSFEEMKEALALNSKSGVHRLVSALEERGFLRRIPNRARCLEIIEQPVLPDCATLSALTTMDFIREAKRRGLVIGDYHRSTYKVGSEVRTHRYFVERRA